MTKEELFSEVDGYFVTHLDFEFWNNLGFESRRAAVSMALDDILAELSGATLSKITKDSYTFKAIAEQAVYLARNYESLNEGKVVTSESVEGLSTGYTLISSKVGIGIRALSFINRAKSLLYGVYLRIRRG